MKEIIEGMKIFLGQNVKDIYRLSATEINIMLNDKDQLDEIRMVTEELVLKSADNFTLAKINFVDDEERVIYSFSLTQ